MKKFGLALVVVGLIVQSLVMPLTAFARPKGWGTFCHLNWGDINGSDTLAMALNSPMDNGISATIPWAALEPVKGQLDTTLIHSLLDQCKQADKTLLLQIAVSGNGASNNPYSSSYTPQWVYDAGVPYITAVHGGVEQKNPAVWNPLFLQLYGKFIQRLGKRLDGYGHLELVQFAPGVFCSTRAYYPNDPSETEQANRLGYSDAAYYAANCYMIQAYTSSFQTTRLALDLHKFTDQSCDRQYNDLNLCTFAVQQGVFPMYHHVTAKANDSTWSVSSYPALFAGYGLSTKLVLGLDNATAQHGHDNWGPIGDIVKFAIGGCSTGLPRMNTCYFFPYHQDVAAATPGNRNFQQAYFDAMQWINSQLRNNADATRQATGG